MVYQGKDHIFSWKSNGFPTRKIVHIQMMNVPQCSLLTFTGGYIAGKPPRNG